MQNYINTCSYTITLMGYISYHVYGICHLQTRRASSLQSIFHIMFMVYEYGLIGLLQINPYLLYLLLENNQTTSPIKVADEADNILT